MVEKSLNGLEFIVIGEVNASGATQYNFTDSNSFSNAIYRIKALDIDGKTTYSVMIKIDRERSAVVIKAFPIPARDELTIQHPLADEESLIDVIGMDGRVVVQSFPVEGTQQSLIRISKLTSGSYFVRFRNRAGVMEVIQFQKN